MKTLKLSLFIILVLIIELPAQGWTFQEIFRYNDDLHTVFFSSVNSGWAAGANGTILSTANGGEDWTISEYDSVSSKNKINKIFFPESDTGWAVGDRGTLLKYDGMSWKKRETNTTDDLYECYFANQQIGWVAGENGVLLKTTDGGSNWVSIKFMNSDINAMYFLDQYTGWIGGLSYIYKTTNGGSTWNFYSLPYALNVVSFDFVDNEKGFCCSPGGKILKTTDAGANWVQLTIDNPVPLSEITFFNEYIGIAVGSLSASMKTTDGGNTWTKISNTGNAIFAVNQTHCWIVGGCGIINKTVNSGNTWIIQNKFLEGQLSSIHFRNAELGWAAGESGIIINTTNGGNTWMLQKTTTTATILSMHFINDSTGWMCGQAGRILKTTNYGKNWTVKNLGIPYYLVSIYFIDELTGWCVGEVSQIKKTTDGGETWIDYSTNQIENRYFNSIVMLTRDFGWLTSDTGLRKTTNGGVTWITHLPTPMSDLLFIDENTGYAINNSALLKTTDGGNTWATIPFDFIPPGGGMIISDLFILDQNNFYITGTNYTSSGQTYFINYSTNGGTSWINLQPPYSFYPRKVHFISPSLGWAVGNRILKYAGVTGIELQEDIPDNYYLNQNYPNPFNPVTNISYYLPESQDVKLKIFDLLGNEVAELENGFKSEGSHVLRFDAKHLSSGVYFYKIKTKNYTETKKLMLLK